MDVPNPIEEAQSSTPSPQSHTQVSCEHTGCMFPHSTPALTTSSYFLMHDGQNLPQNLSTMRVEFPAIVVALVATSGAQRHFDGVLRWLPGLRESNRRMKKNGSHSELPPKIAERQLELRRHPWCFAEF
eukprot:TRINITY_DN284_c0_g2_i2.p1 TRINITY_DN284_c0_g2~~TRINITY_DN284_c0_g2_i2.p1  ORF type:complete len:129 (+),score=15.66 TRINITY_DN284_c0_g2_i2:291-677(+)